MKKTKKIAMISFSAATMVIMPTTIALMTPQNVISKNSIKHKINLMETPEQYNKVVSSTTYKKSYLLQGNKIKQGLSDATNNMLEDKQGNIWAMGNKSPLQVLRKGATKWEAAKHRSLIIDGKGGHIFQTSKGDIYAIGWWGQFQVLRNGEDEWERVYIKTKTGIKALVLPGDPGLRIFEDSHGNLWMGSQGTTLKVLRVGENNWEEAKHNNNIVDGGWFTMFEDSKNRLWAMGLKKGLQQLNSNTNNWEDANNGSLITDGSSGTIVEANGNVFILSRNHFQVLKDGKTTWEEIPNISGAGSKLFKTKNGDLLLTTSTTVYKLDGSLRNPSVKTFDSFSDWKKVGGDIAHGSGLDTPGAKFVEGDDGTLWFLGKKGVLSYDGNKWEFASKNGNKIKDGDWGELFKDSRGNIWAMGKDVPLQVLQKGATQWLEESKEKIQNEQLTIKEKIEKMSFVDASKKAKSLKKTSKNIVAEIGHDKEKLKTILGIDFDAIVQGTSTKIENFSLSATDGKIKVSVTIITKNAPQEKLYINSYESIETLTDKQMTHTKSNKETNHAKSNLGLIIGASVGGVVGLIGIILLTIFIIKKKGKKSKKDNDQDFGSKLKGLI